MARHVEQLWVKELFVENKFEMLKPVWRGIRMPLSGMGRAGANDPAWTQVGATALYVPGFAATGTDELFFFASVGHMTKPGTEYRDTYDENDQVTNEMKCYLNWAPSSTNTGNVEWTVDKVIYIDEDSEPQTAQEKTVVAANGTATKRQSTLISTCDMSSFTIHTLVGFRVGRDNGVNDTFTGTALGFYVEQKMPISRLGTENIEGDA